MNLKRACVGLGANLGDAVVALQHAARLIAAWPEATGLRASSLYRSAPVESSGPDYWNAVLSFDTSLSPERLLARLQAIEQSQGRERPYRNAPRTLDLDLLALGDEQRATARFAFPTRVCTSVPSCSCLCWRSNRISFCRVWGG